MLGCLACGEIFDVCEYETEYVEGNEGYKYSVCPYCHSDNIKEVEKCELCGEYHLGEGDECEDCSNEFHSFLKAFYMDTTAYFNCDEEKIRDALERRFEI